MNLKKIAVIVMSALTLFGTVDTVVNTQTVSAATTSKTQTYKSNLSSANQKAKEWIAYRESRGSYSARNGRYIGRYQLDASYLKGDYSKTNQERTADRYVKARYGSWVNAKKHWQRCGWY